VELNTYSPDQDRTGDLRISQLSYIMADGDKTMRNIIIFKNIVDYFYEKKLYVKRGESRYQVININ
jgi:hypothetical protein